MTEGDDVAKLTRNASQLVFLNLRIKDRDDLFAIDTNKRSDIHHAEHRQSLGVNNDRSEIRRAGTEGES
ncbi:MAG: hypothetical protein QM811_05630 [Pirellulales bacterium]